MDNLFTHWNHWHWGMLAVGLTVVEVAWPHAIFLWLGLAAGVVSGVLFLLPTLGWPLELLLFVSISGTALFLSRPRVSRHAHGYTPATGQRASLYVGRLFTLTSPIRDGLGTLTIGNTRWTIRGLDMAVGTPVKVVGFEGDVLSVEGLEQNTIEQME
ncbi:MAG: NfeD family protein [Magnetococcus sp. MYC-9]